jgi:uncharacterized protein
MTDLHLEPISRSERIASLDVLRGVAALGILLMNIPAMGLAWQSARPPMPLKPDIDWIAYALQSVLASGAMRGLFTLLFGAGMIVMLTRSDPLREAAAVQAWFTRCFALLLLGIVNFTLFLWPGEILFCYGVAGMVAFCFRKANNRLLIVAATAILAVMTLGLFSQFGDKLEMLRQKDAAVVAIAHHQRPTPEQQKAYDQYNEALRKTASPQMLAQERVERTTFPAVLRWSLGAWTEYNVGSMLATWSVMESIGGMLLGMAMMRARVLTGQRSTGFYVRMTLIALTLGLLLRGWVEMMLWHDGYMRTYPNFLVAMLTYEAGRLAMSLGFVGLVVLLLRMRMFHAPAVVLTAVGRMALTTYIGQSIITSVLFYGFGLWGHFGFAQLMGIAVLIWIAQGAFCMIWLRFLPWARLNGFCVRSPMGHGQGSGCLIAHALRVSLI